VEPARVTPNFQSWRTPSPAETHRLVRVTHHTGWAPSGFATTRGTFPRDPAPRYARNWVTSPCSQTRVIDHPVARAPPSGAAGTPVTRSHRSHLDLNHSLCVISSVSLPFAPGPSRRSRPAESRHHTLYSGTPAGVDGEDSPGHTYSTFYWRTASP